MRFYEAAIFQGIINNFLKNQIFSLFNETVSTKLEPSINDWIRTNIGEPKKSAYDTLKYYGLPNISSPAIHGNLSVPEYIARQLDYVGTKRQSPINLNHFRIGLNLFSWTSASLKNQ